MEHAACRRAVDVLAVRERVGLPFFACVPCDDACLDGGEVSHVEPAAVLRNEGNADKLAECVRDILVDHLHSLIVAGLHKRPRSIQVRQMVLRQILKLDEPSGPAACAIRAVEHEHAASTAIGTYGALHGLVFLHAGFRKLLPELQHFSEFRWRGFEQGCHCFFAEAVDLHAVVGEPLLHLLDAVRILQIRNRLHLLCQLAVGAGVHVDGLLHEIHVDAHASVVDLLVDVVLVPHEVRHREVPQFPLDHHLDLDVALVVLFECRPFAGIIRWQVPSASAVRLGGCAGDGEVFDEGLAFIHLLVGKLQDCADTF